MAITDVHAHILTHRLVAALSRLGVEDPPSLVDEPDGQVSLTNRNGGRFGPIPAGIFDIERRLHDMDQRGVDVQMLSVAPMLFGYGQQTDVGVRLSSTINDCLLEAAHAYPDRFGVLADLPLTDPAACTKELSRVSSDPLVRGVQIGTNVNGSNLDDPLLDPVWADLEERDLPVVVHPGMGNAVAKRTPRYHLVNLIGNPTDSTIAIASLIFGGVVKRYPGLRFGFVHGGGFAPYQIGRWDHGWACRPEARAHIDAPPSAYLKSLYCDSLTHDDLSLAFLGARMGWDHVVLGSDYPFDMAPEDPVGAVRRQGLDAADERRVLEENADRFLRAAVRVRA